MLSLSFLYSKFLFFAKKHPHIHERRQKNPTIQHEMIFFSSLLLLMLFAHTTDIRETYSYARPRGIFDEGCESSKKRKIFHSFISFFANGHFSSDEYVVKGTPSE
jgi:hypothetical protein